MNVKYRMDPFVKVAIILFFIAAVIAGFSSCNTVKQLERNEKKKQQVLDWAVMQGICKADTTVITNSDTLVSYDTSYITDTVTKVKYDTSYLTLKGATLTKLITKTVTIRDTIIRTVTDQSLITVLNRKVQEQTNEADNQKERAKRLVWWLVGLGVLLAIMIGLFFYKLFK